MVISEVMSGNVRSVPPTTSAADARAIMQKNRIHHLVVKKREDLLGVFSARDLSRRTDRSAPPPKTVQDVMSRHVLSIEGQATLGRAAQLMRGHTIGCLVVLERGRVAGIVTSADLLGLLGRGAERPPRTSRRTAVHHRVAHRHRARGDGVW